MLLNKSAGPVPGPWAMRVTVPSSTFQSTSASISRNSPAEFSAFIQLRISPKATGLRCTLILWFSARMFLMPSVDRKVLGLRLGREGETLGGRCDLGDEVAHERFVGQGCDCHFARLEPRRAGINGLAVQFHHAFLAGIGIYAGETDGERGVLVDADPAQPVEHRLAALERHLMGFPMALGPVEAAPDF